MDVLQAVVSDNPNFHKYPENIKLDILSKFKLFDWTGNKVFDTGMEDTKNTFESSEKFRHLYHRK